MFVEKKRKGTNKIMMTEWEKKTRQKKGNESWFMNILN
jgi:hypothetical protein